jgi:hypothetical protein
MKRTLVLSAVLALVCGAAFVAFSTADVAGSQSNELKISSLVSRLETLTPARVDALEPLEVRRFEVPGPSVDVMRAQIVETYAIEGIGEDTVQLSGWVAVKHFNARPVDGSDTVTWENAVVDTQFVGMDLRGHSDLFGPVVVKLDAERPVQGQVGRIQIPELAQTVLLAQLRQPSAQTVGSGRGQKGDINLVGKAPGDGCGGIEQQAQDRVLETEIGDGDGAPTNYGSDATDIGQSGGIEPSFCAAPVNVAAFMPELGLEMRLAKPAIWYSRVETIPPVGHTASVTIEPVDLIAAGRTVGQLTSGKVCFREVVSRTELEDTVPFHSDRLAQN